MSTIFTISKPCIVCRVDKPRHKYYKHPLTDDGLMHHCKACHNGCAESSERRSTESLERQWGDPDESAIRRACEAIQSRWSDAEKAKRRERPWFAKKAGLV